MVEFFLRFLLGSYWGRSNKSFPWGCFQKYCSHSGPLRQESSKKWWLRLRWTLFRGNMLIFGRVNTNLANDRNISLGLRTAEKRMFEFWSWEFYVAVHHHLFLMSNDKRLYRWEILQVVMMNGDRFSIMPEMGKVLETMRGRHAENRFYFHWVQFPG